MAESPFFLVWCPTRSAPTVMQPTFEIAESEAKRLARINPGEEFFVSAAVARVIKHDVGVTRFTIPSPSAAVAVKPTETCPYCSSGLAPIDCDCVPF